MRISVLGGLLGGLAVALWWLFFSRAPRSERWGAILLMIAALTATYLLNHESMGQLWLISYAAPPLTLAFFLWAAVSRRLTKSLRWLSMVATILLSCGTWTLVRGHGITGDGAMDFSWRWAETPEDRLVAETGAPSPATSEFEAADSEAEWPGFRGHGRNSIVPSVRIEADWVRSPPVELWRRPIGPGWSSFAIRGDFLYTQEQRGDDEVVASYRLSTGEPIWRHHNAARFWDSQGGPGPRGTPTLSKGRLYALGATGVLHALDAADGSVLWQRHVAADAEVELPEWGFSSAPLVIEDLVIVAAAGTLVAYELATGEPVWFGTAGGESYSSPQLVTIDGVEQVLMSSKTSVVSVDPRHGTPLWEHTWPGFRIVQPALTANGDVLIASERNGVRLIAVTQAPGQEPAGWKVEERWTSNRLKPYFSDFVVHDGHAFGFDGSIMASIDLEDGTRTWKGGRYGHGQVLLLPDQDLLLVVSERGELALVAAKPETFTELARIPALEGKTWNHPALVGDLLLVRNSQEMAAFRLPFTSSGPAQGRAIDSAIQLP